MNICYNPFSAPKYWFTGCPRSIGISVPDRSEYATDHRIPRFQMSDMQTHRPSFQQTNEAGDAETMKWDIDLMDVRFLPH